MKIICIFISNCLVMSYFFCTFAQTFEKGENMSTLEITLLAIIGVTILAIGVLSAPNEKAKQMHEQAKNVA